MYCKYCGAQLPDGEDLCPKCGKHALKIMGGNGFWDLAGITPPASAAAAAPASPKKENKSRQMRIIYILAAVIALLAGICIVQAGRLNGLKAGKTPGISSALETQETKAEETEETVTSETEPLQTLAPLPEEFSEPVSLIPDTQESPAPSEPQAEQSTLPAVG